MKFLTTVLTSGRMDLLTLALTSIPRNNDVHIICNTLDEDFRKELDNSNLNWQYQIVHTESDGLAGKGQQSVLDHFLTQTDYTHLIKLDGDDRFFDFVGHQQIIDKMTANPDINVLALLGDEISTSLGTSSWKNVDLRSYVESKGVDLTADIATWLFEMSGYTGDNEYWFERMVCVDKIGAAAERYLSLKCNTEDVQLMMRLKLMYAAGELDYRQMVSTNCYKYNKLDGFGASDSKWDDPKLWREEMVSPFTDKELEIISATRIPKV